MVFSVALIFSYLASTILLSAQASDVWTPQTSGTAARLRGLSVVSPQVVWASGTQGTVVRTLDGGVTWQVRPVPGASTLDFRDMHALDDRVAHVLSIGPGEQSRIYKTTDGGASWELKHKNRDSKVFLDALAFWDADHGIVVGDPVEGRFTILTTDDGGKTWIQLREATLPRALAGEGAFAASGTCLVVQGDRDVWFGTGGAPVARVFRSTDRGRTWSVHETPIKAGNASSGIFSLAFRDPNHGVAVGGDYQRPEQSGAFVATSGDGGRSWTEPQGMHPRGYRSAVAYIPGPEEPTLVAVGPSGSDFSTDDGRTWRPLGTLGFHVVGFASRERDGWAAGEAGSIAKLRGDRLRISR